MNENPTDLLRGWRNLVTDALEDRIHQIELASVSHHYDAEDWKIVGRMRRTLKARRKKEATFTDGDGRVIPAVANHVLAKKIAAIRELVQRTRENIVEIGRHLSELRDQNRGGWLVSLEAEFGWSDQTAYNFIHVFERSRDPKFQTCLELDLPLRVLYQLAAPRANAAREKIAERIEAGEKVTTETVIKAVTGCRKSSAPDSTQPTQSDGAEALAAYAKDDAGGVDPTGDSRGQNHAGVAPEPKSKLRKAWDAATRAERDELRKQMSLPFSLLELWEVSTTEERQPVRDRTIDEFFALASGDNILEHIRAAKRNDTVIADLLDALGVDGMRVAMSPAFGQQLRAVLPKHRPNPLNKPGKKLKTMRMEPTGTDASGNPVFAQVRGNRSQH
jgi:hypothetical protein